MGSEKTVWETVNICRFLVHKDFPVKPTKMEVIVFTRKEIFDSTCILKIGNRSLGQQAVLESVPKLRYQERNGLSMANTWDDHDRDSE